MRFTKDTVIKSGKYIFTVMYRGKPGGILKQVEVICISIPFPRRYTLQDILRGWSFEKFHIALPGQVILSRFVAVTMKSSF